MRLRTNKHFNSVKLIIISFILLFALPCSALSEDNNDTFIKAKIMDKLQHHDFHDAGDEDWAMFYGVSGETYTIKATNLEIRCNAVVELYEADGETLLAQKDNKGFGEDEVLVWKCLSEGHYYVKVRNSDPQLFGDNTGYDLLCSNSQGNDAYEDDDSSGQARIITVGGDIQHHNFHDAGDEDWVMFYALETWYTIEVINLESKCDAVIELYDTDGKKMLKSVDVGIEGAKESMDFNFSKTGIYYVKVKNYESDIFGENTGYDLRVYRPVASSDGIEGKKAIIVAGGGNDHTNFLWDATKLCADYAYNALIFQGYKAENIYYLTPDSDFEANNYAATSENLRYAIETWAGDAYWFISYRKYQGDNR